MSYQLKKIRKDLSRYLDNTYKEKVDVISIRGLSKVILLKTKPPEFDAKKWIDNCRWIIHCIIQLSFDKRYTDKGNNFVPLYSKILKENCGNYYRRYIEGLIEAGIIETDLKYSARKHESWGFKIADKYASIGYKHITLTEQFLVRSIRRNRKENIAKLKIKAYPIAHLVRWLTYDGLQMNKDAALDFLNTYISNLTRELAKRKLKLAFRSKQEEFRLRRYEKIRFQIQNWGNHTNISIDNAGGRLYSPITGLPSLFRNFLTYNGETLVSFDIKNSQPLHFLVMLKKEFWKNYTPGITLSNLDKELYNYMVKEEGYPTNIMFQEYDKNQADKGFDFANFPKLVQSGKLYEFICFKFFGKHVTKGGIDRFSTRSLTKKEVLRLMYFNPKEPYSEAKDVFKSFSALFPFEAGIMNLMKKRKYSDFSIILQKIEAQMLLHTVAKKVFDHNPDIPLFTVHDSIVTTEQYSGILKSILEDEYVALLAFKPQIEVTTYSEGNAWGEIGKYVKSKVDQADVEISLDYQGYPKLFRFLKCEHWDFERKFRESKVTIAQIPDFAIYNTVPPGLESLPIASSIKKLKK